MSYLIEAFKALNALDEDVFSVSDDGIEKLSAFEDDDTVSDDITIYDVDAEDESELEDSYIGKIILDCNVCHSKLYKDKADVVIDEESNDANIDMECPYCYSVDGFKVIGEVAPMSTETEEKVSSEDDDVEDSETPEMEESVASSDNNKETLTEECQTAEEEKPVEEAVDLATKENTVAGVLAKHMPELYAITDVNELRKAVIDIVDNSDIADKAIVSKLRRDLFSKKSVGALLSTIATYMTGTKVAKVGRKNESLKDASPDVQKAIDWYVDSGAAAEEAEEYSPENPDDWNVDNPYFEDRAVSWFESSPYRYAVDDVDDADKSTTTNVTVDGITYVPLASHPAYNLIKASKSVRGDVVIPETIGKVPVEYIDEDAFKKRSITSIVIPKTVTTIGSGAFEDCKKLARVEIHGDPYMWLDPFAGSDNVNIICHKDSEVEKWAIANNIPVSYFEMNESKSIKESAEDNLGTDLDKYQKWVDYDMKKYHRISNKTNSEIRKAGLQIVKDKYGDYQVTAGKYDESLKESLNLNKAKNIIDVLYKNLGIWFKHSAGGVFFLDRTLFNTDLFDKLIKNNYKMIGDILEEQGLKYDISEDAYISKDENLYVTIYGDTGTIIVQFEEMESESLNESVNSDIVSMIKKQFPKATVKTSIRKHSDVHKSNPDTPTGKTKYVDIRITPDEESSVNAILQYCNHNIKKVLDSDSRFDYYGDVPARNPRGGKEVVLSYQDYSGLSDDEYRSLLGESVAEDLNRYEFLVKRYGHEEDRETITAVSLEDAEDQLNSDGHVEYWDYLPDFNYDIEESYSGEESLKESVKDVTITTDDSRTTMTSEDDGKVTVTTEPVEKDEEEAEILAPVSDETEMEIEENSAEDMDAEIDDIDSDSFEESLSSVLKEQYDNVNSYKMSSCSFGNNDVVTVNGIIEFTSGKKGNAQIKLESHTIDKKGNATFLTESSKLFSTRYLVSGNLKEKKFITESIRSKEDK